MVPRSHGGYGCRDTMGMLGGELDGSESSDDIKIDDAEIFDFRPRKKSSVDFTTGGAANVPEQRFNGDTVT